MGRIFQEAEHESGDNWWRRIFSKLSSQLPKELELSRDVDKLLGKH
jgi:hypothetical protein